MSRVSLAWMGGTQLYGVECLTGRTKSSIKYAFYIKTYKYLKSWAFVFTFDSTVTVTNIANFFLMLWKCFVSKNCIKIKTSDLAHVDSSRRKYVKIVFYGKLCFIRNSVILTFSLDGRDRVNGFHTIMIVINRNIYSDWISPCGGMFWCHAVFCLFLYSINFEIVICCSAPVVLITGW